MYIIQETFFNEVVPLGKIMFPQRAIDCLEETPVSDMKNLLSSFWPRESKRLPKQYRLL